MMGFILRLLEGLGGGTGCPGEAPGRSLLLEVREAIRKAGGIENLLPSTVSNYMLSEYAETFGDFYFPTLSWVMVEFPDRLQAHTFCKLVQRCRLGKKVDSGEDAMTAAGRLQWMLNRSLSLCTVMIPRLLNMSMGDFLSYQQLTKTQAEQRLYHSLAAGGPGGPGAPTAPLTAVGQGMASPAPAGAPGYRASSSSPLFPGCPITSVPYIILVGILLLQICPLAALIVAVWLIIACALAGSLTGGVLGSLEFISGMLYSTMWMGPV